MNIVPADFSSNLGLDGCTVTDEAEDSIRWVFGELADELELDDISYASLGHVAALEGLIN